MKATRVKICALDDPPAFPEYSGRKTCLVDLECVTILQRGCESGATSVALTGITPDGEVVNLQCSAAMFETIMGAVKGAVHRFGK